jgi:hypothetical protein
MKAVAIMTPDPKYFVMKNASGGTRIRFVRAAAIGSRTPARRLAVILDVENALHFEHIPHIEPNPMTKTEDIRSPNRPS